jgi:hypothetical protein
MHGKGCYHYFNYFQAIHGKMAENMRGNINMIKNMDGVLIHGQMGGNMKVFN